MFRLKYINVFFVTVFMLCTCNLQSMMDEKVLEITDHGIKVKKNKFPNLKFDEPAFVNQELIKVYYAPFLESKKKCKILPINTKTIVHFDGAVTKVWDIGNGKGSAFLDIANACCAPLEKFTQDSILLGNEKDRGFVLWNFKNGKFQKFKKQDNNAMIVAAKKLSETTIATISDTGDMDVWDIPKKKCLKSTTGTFPYWDSVVRLSSTKLVSIGTGSLTFWDVEKEEDKILSKDHIFRSHHKAFLSSSPLWDLGEMLFTSIVGIPNQRFVFAYYEKIRNTDYKSTDYGNTKASNYLALYGLKEIQLFSEQAIWNLCYVPCRDVLVFSTGVGCKINLSFMRPQNFGAVLEEINLTPFLENNDDGIETIASFDNENSCMLVTKKGYVIEIPFNATKEI